MFDIILVLFPPHSTHILQPLNVVVFQPLKQAHQKMVIPVNTAQVYRFTRYDFTSGLNEITAKGFTKHHTIKGFTDSGLFPPNRKEPLKWLFQVNPACP